MSIRDYKKLEFRRHVLRVYEVSGLYQSVPLRESLMHKFRDDVNYPNMERFENLFDYIRPKPRKVVKNGGEGWLSELSFVVLGCLGVDVVSHYYSIKLRPRVRKIDE